MPMALPQPAWLLEALGVKRLKPQQWEAICTLTRKGGRDVFLHAPCGSGKSLVFLGALLMLKHAVGVLIVPMLSIQAMYVQLFKQLGVETQVLNATSRADICGRLESWDVGARGPPLVVLATPQQASHRLSCTKHLPLKF